MDRISAQGYVGNGAGKRVFTNENLALGVDGTDVDSVWLTGVQEEIMGCIEGFGVAPNAAVANQMYQAITIDAQGRAQAAENAAIAAAEANCVGVTGDSRMTGEFFIQGSVVLSGGGQYGNTQPCEAAIPGSAISENGTVNAYTGNVGGAGQFGAPANTNMVQYWCAGTVVGAVFTNGSSTSYVTTSDYRIKQGVTTLAGALERVVSVSARRFNFVGNADVVDGFLAHEVAAAVPEAVIGTKDATRTVTNAVISTKGNVLAEGVEQSAFDPEKYAKGATWEASTSLPVLQQIDQSKLVPVLWAAVRELAAEVAALKAAKA